MLPYKTRRPKRHTLPDWPAVQRGEDAGDTIIKFWQEYAARVPLPYGASAFYKEFRKWQATAPADPAEFAVSEFYWQYKASIA